LIKMIDLIRKIHIHPLLWIIIAISIATAHFLEVCFLLVIIFIHEMGHAAAASFFSWRIKRISLLPFGGVAEMDEHGNRPLREELIVVLAGPIQHLWLYALSYLLYSMSLLPSELFQMFLDFNGMVLLFNLFPIWPLDGGKLAFLLFSLKTPFPEAHRMTINLSAVFLCIFAILTLFAAPYHLNLWVIIAFLSFSLYHEWKQRRYVFMRFLLERYYGKKDGPHLLIPIKAAEEDRIIQVLQRFQRGCKHPIIIEGTDRDKTMLDENEILHAYFTEKRVSDKIADLLFSY
jgi:stage IV sporulation protein FB